MTYLYSLVYAKELTFRGVPVTNYNDTAQGVGWSKGGLVGRCQVWIQFDNTCCFSLVLKNNLPNMEHANLEKKRRKFRQGNNLFFTYTMIGYSGALSLIGWLWDFCTILLFIVIFLYQNVFFILLLWGKHWVSKSA